MATSFFDAAAGRVATHILQGRTDSAGVAQTDVDGEDLRIANDAFTEGIGNRADGYKVLATSPTPDMNVHVGSGTVGDVVLVAGEEPQQGNYRVSWPDATTSVTVPAADLSDPRIDEVYLVVEDTQYDGSGRTLARLALRDGTPAGTPAAPGPDPNWTASLLLAQILVGAGVTEVTDADITDSRVFAAVTLAGSDRVGTGLNPLNTILEAPAGGVVAVQIDGANEMIVSASQVDFGGNDIVDVGSFDAASQAWEVDDSVEVANFSLTGSFTNVASVNLTIPGAWNEWKCYATATGVVGGLSGSYQVRIAIDGIGQQSLVTNFTEGHLSEPWAVGGRRTGITTTGSRTISVQALEGSAGREMQDIFLYARAVRTA